MFCSIHTWKFLYKIEAKCFCGRKTMKKNKLTLTCYLWIIWTKNIVNAFELFGAAPNWLPSSAATVSIILQINIGASLVLNTWLFYTTYTTSCVLYKIIISLHAKCHMERWQSSSILLSFLPLVLLLPNSSNQNGLICSFFMFCINYTLESSEQSVRALTLAIVTE